MIEVDRLSKCFGSVEAVREMSFTAPNGAITGLLGANGAGKSTTFRIACGMVRADSGTVRVDGISSSEDRISFQRRIGALLDHTGLYSRLTARENLAYFAQLRQMSCRSLADVCSAPNPNLEGKARNHRSRFAGNLVNHGRTHPLCGGSCFAVFMLRSFLPS